MEVTKENFREAFALLKTSIKNADFIAIDGEFTGLSTIRNRWVTYDTMEEKFDLLRRGTSQMLLVQYGICLFTWNEEKSLYEALPMSFYLFPRPYKRNLNDVMFTSQSSSLDFLANNGFDFNKWIHKGISFLSPSQAAKARERLERDLSFCAATPTETTENNSTAKVFIPKNQKTFIDGILDSINNFLKDTEKSSLDLPDANPFQRKLIYEIVGEKYPVGLFLESVSDMSNQTKFLRVVKVTEFGMQELKNESRRKELEYFDEILGFSKVMKLLTEHTKPIIGHNMLLDLFLTVFHFFDNRVENLRDFKEVLHKNFPVIFDTKLITASQPIAQNVEGTSLSKLFLSLGNSHLPDPCVIRVDNQADSSDKEEKNFHQAGYDAYCTGSVFISACKCLVNNLDKNAGNRVNIDSEIISPFANRVKTFNIIDIPYMDITGPDKVPSRKGVFYVKFPRQWREKDIEDLFSPVCAITRPIVWLGNSSVYVTLADESSYQDVIDEFVINKKSTDPYFVLPYAATVNTPNIYDDNPDIKQETEEKEPIRSRKRKAESSDTEEGEIVSEDETHRPTDCKTKKVEKLFEAPSEW